MNFDGSTAKGDRGSWLMNQGVIQLPPTNQSLDKEAIAAYTFIGEHDHQPRWKHDHGDRSRKSDGVMLTNQSMPYPDNGVRLRRERSEPAVLRIQPRRPVRLTPRLWHREGSGNYGTSLTIVRKTTS